MPNCNYIGDSSSTYQSHVRKQHKSLYSTKNIYGWFWAIILLWIKDPSINRSPTINEIFRNRQGFKCKHCPALCSTKLNITLHSVNLHGTSRIEGRKKECNKILAESLIYKDFTSEELKELEKSCINTEITNTTIKNKNKEAEELPINQNIEESEKESNLMKVRRIIDEERQRKRDQQMIKRIENNNETNNTQVQTQIINNRTLKEKQKQNEVKKPINQENKNINKNKNNHPKLNNLKQQDLDFYLDKARKWIYKNQKEENFGISLPKCNTKMRKCLLKDISKLFKDKIKPLFKICEIKNNYIKDEQKWYILEGIIAKTTLLIRKQIRKILKIPINKMIKRKPIINRNDDQNKRLRISYTKEQNIFKLYSHIEKFLEIKDKPLNQNLENYLSNLETKIVDILQRMDDDFISKTFGDKTIQAFRNLINDNSDHRNEKLNWIKNFIEQEENLINNNLSNKYKLKIQKFYQEDPRRCISWNICTNPTPECNIPIKDFEEFYTKEWKENNNFKEPNLNEIWNLNKVFNEEDKEEFNQLLLNKEKIREVINSRPNLSSHGLDGISNAIWKMNTKITTKIIKIIISNMLVYKKIPDMWRESKTIMLFKKGDPNQVRS